VNLGARHEHAGVLAWIDRESSKPGRASDEVWVLHSTDQFARERIDADPESAGATMLDAFFAATGAPRAEPVARHARLWKTALPVAPLCDGCLYDESLRVGACGDWCMGARVEGAYLSGLAMAERLNGRHRDFLATCALAHALGLIRPGPAASPEPAGPNREPCRAAPAPPICPPSPASPAGASSPGARSGNATGRA
jgi:hypothetical protein